MKNPFCFRELPVTAPFCNRTNEIKELLSHARNRVNVVLFSPRRYGKTSLVKRIKDHLKSKGVATVYVDFYGVDSVEDLTARLASRVYKFSRDSGPLFKKMMRFLSSWRPVLRPDTEYGATLTVEPATKKTGIALLEETLSGLGQFIESYKKGVLIIFDEFQEIVELKESLQIEGIMRSHIQTHSNASYFFVGSRRRILSDIFNDRKRPFYRSSINYPLNPLPLDESVQFIIDQFKKGGKDCPADIAKRIVDTVKGYPYYIQRIPYSIFEVSSKKIKDNDYTNGFRQAVEEEKPVFEAFLRSLALQQIKLLSALAEQPTTSPYSAEYMSRYSLGSIGGVQGAVKKLIALDYIENRDRTFYIVDPVFGIWLRNLKGY